MFALSCCKLFVAYNLGLSRYLDWNYEVQAPPKGWTQQEQEEIELSGATSHKQELLG